MLFDICICSQRAGTASGGRFCAGNTGVGSFSAVNFVGAADPLLFAALADFLQFRWHNELTINASVIAGYARIVIVVFSQRAFVIASLKARFTSSPLWVAGS
jgi:hypothetical protein